MKRLLIPTCLVFLLNFSGFSQKESISDKLIKNYNSQISAHLGHENDRGICLTPILNEVRKNWDQLSEEAKKVFRVYQDRPPISNEQVFESEYFDIHYTTSGDDGVDPTDNDGNGTPDYIDFMAEVSDFVFDIDIAQRGFTAPPPDDGAGGNDRYDIYVFNLETGTYGYVQGELVIEDNPNSTERIEVSAVTSFMAMRNNYDAFPNTAEENIKVTLAHELSHSIDYGYGSGYTGYFLEAKGAWEEQRIYPDLTDNFQYLTSYLDSDYALDYGDDDNDNVASEASRWYAGWLFNKHLVDLVTAEFGPNTIIKDFLTRGYDSDNDNSFMDEELKENWNTSLDEVHSSFRVTNALFTGDSKYAPFFYEKASQYREYLGLDPQGIGPIKLEGEFSYSGTSELVWNSATDGNGRLQRLSADYLLFDVGNSDPFQIELSANETDDMDIFLIPFNSTTGDFEIIESNDAYVIRIEDQASYDVYVLAVVRGDKERNGAYEAQYEITFTELSENSAPVIVDQSFEINENMNNGMSVGIVEATDPDGNGLTFTFENSSASDAFAIDETTGEITVQDTDQLNYEVTPSFNYTVNVSDGELNSTASIVIDLIDLDECGEVSIEFTVTNSEPGASTGSITIVNIDGGTEPFEFLWSNGESTQNITDLSAGEYTLTLTDVNLCQTTFDFTVEEEEILSFKEINKISVDVFPNPAISHIRVGYKGIQVEKISILDFSGKVLETFDAEPEGTNLKINYPSGIYLISLDNKLTKRLIVK